MHADGRKSSTNSTLGSSSTCSIGPVSRRAPRTRSRYWEGIPQRLTADPRDCVVVDDRLDYLEAAASVGILALLLDRKGAHRPEGMPAYLQATLRNLAGLPHWVDAHVAAHAR